MAKLSVDPLTYITTATGDAPEAKEAGSRLYIEQIGNKNAYIYHCQNGRVYLDNTKSRHVSVFKEIMGYPDVRGA